MEAMLPNLAPALNKHTNKTNKTPLDDGWMMYFYYILPCLPPKPPINKQTNNKQTTYKSRANGYRVFDFNSFLLE